jgi:hypothetical protein
MWGYLGAFVLGGLTLILGVGLYEIHWLEKQRRALPPGTQT